MEALLLLDWNDPHVGVLTGKVFEYLHATAPILVVGGGAESEMAQLIHRAKRGVILGIDELRIAATLGDLVGHRNTKQEDADREFIATLTRQNQALRMLNLIRSLPPAKA